MKFYIFLLVFVIFIGTNVKVLANPVAVVQEQAKQAEVKQTEVREVGTKQTEIKQTEAKQVEKDLNPKTLLSSAKSVHVKSYSVYFEPGTLENALRKNSKFEKLSLVLIKSEHEADIVIEIDRVLFTPVFTFRAVETKTGVIVATGKATSVIGIRLLRSASGSMAKQFLNQVDKARK